MSGHVTAPREHESKCSSLPSRLRRVVRRPCSDNNTRGVSSVLSWMEGLERRICVPVAVMCLGKERSCRSWLGMENFRAKKLHILAIKMLRIDLNRGEGTRSASQVVRGVWWYGAPGEREGVGEEGGRGQNGRREEEKEEEEERERRTRRRRTGEQEDIRKGNEANRSLRYTGLNQYRRCTVARVWKHSNIFTNISAHHQQSKR